MTRERQEITHHRDPLIRRGFLEGLWNVETSKPSPTQIALTQSSHGHAQSTNIQTPSSTRRRGSLTHSQHHGEDGSTEDPKAFHLLLARVKIAASTEQQRTLEIPRYTKTYAPSARTPGSCWLQSWTRLGQYWRDMFVSMLSSWPPVQQPRVSWRQCVVHALYRDPHRDPRKGLFLSLCFAASTSSLPVC